MKMSHYQYPKRKPIICYNPRPTMATVFSHLVEEMKFAITENTLVSTTIVPKREAKVWKVFKGQICRISLIEGSQVGDVNLWHLHDTNERFYSGKTRQIHSTHLTIGDRLWSNMPFLRPMATVIGDSIGYGCDEDNGGIHDVIGTRCDPYTYQRMTGKLKETPTCHTSLVKAIEPIGLKESDVHDVFNIFMCSGFTKDTREYFVKASPARKGDYIDMVADIDLLFALSACPQGDVSLQCGSEFPVEKCHPLKAEIYDPPQELKQKWIDMNEMLSNT